VIFFLHDKKSALELVSLLLAELLIEHHQWTDDVAAAEDKLN